MTDMTPPRPQDVEPSDSAEELWADVLAEAEARCAECGTILFPHEEQRQSKVEGSKFAGMCDECVKLKLGLK